MCLSTTSGLNATTPIETTRSAQCGGNGDRIARHNAICDVLHTAALAPYKEMPNLISSSRLMSTSPPGAVGALLPSISPLPPAVDLGFTPGHTCPAVQVGVQRKLTSHRSAGVEFIPIVAVT